MSPPLMYPLILSLHELLSPGPRLPFICNTTAVIGNVGKARMWARFAWDSRARLQKGDVGA